VERAGIIRDSRGRLASQRASGLLCSQADLSPVSALHSSGFFAHPGASWRMPDRFIAKGQS